MPAPSDTHTHTHAHADAAACVAGDGVEVSDAAFELFCDSVRFDPRSAGVTPAGLAALYSAWVPRHPYDTIRKTLAVAAGATPPGVDPDATVRWALGTGAGGTCVAGAVVFAALARRCGFDATLVGCSLEAERAGALPGHGDTAGSGAIVHLGVRVDLDGSQWWCDTAVDHQRPLEIRAGGRPDVAPGRTEARVQSGRFLRRSQTSKATLAYRFETTLDAAGLGVLAASTAATIDWSSPFYAVRPRDGFAVRGGPDGWMALQLGAREPWTPVDGRWACERLGLHADLADEVLAVAAAGLLRRAA